MNGRWTLLVALGSSTACAHAAVRSSEGPVEHELTETIFDLRRGRSVRPEELFAQLGEAPLVIVGEQHDNGRHHVIEAEVMRRVAAAGRKPALALEMLSADESPALAKHLGAGGGVVELGRAVRWEERGWPSWSAYAPVVREALIAGLPLVPVNLTHAELEEAYAAGAAALAPPALESFRLAPWTLPEEAVAELAEEVRVAHCGHADAALVATMSAIQELRDAVMAQRTLAGATADGAVLIAGAEHARRDRGVAWHWARLAPDRHVVTLALLEARPGRTRLSDYVATGSRAAYDFVWFTAPADTEDPCARFQAQLEKMRARRQRGENP